MENLEFTDREYDGVRNGDSRKIASRPASFSNIITKFYNWRIERLENKKLRKENSYDEYRDIVDAVKSEFHRPNTYGNLKLAKKKIKINKLQSKIDLLQTRYEKYLTIKFKALKMKEKMFGNAKNNIKSASSLDDESVISSEEVAEAVRETARDINKEQEVSVSSATVPNMSDIDEMIKNETNDNSTILDDEKVAEAVREAASEIFGPNPVEAGEGENTFVNQEEDNLRVSKNSSSKAKTDIAVSDSMNEVKGMKGFEGLGEPSKTAFVPPVVENMEYKREPIVKISKDGKSKVFDFNPEKEVELDEQSYMDDNGTKVTTSNDNKSKVFEFNYEEKLQEEVNERFNSLTDGLDLNFSDEEIQQAKDSIRSVVLTERENKKKAEEIKKREEQIRVQEKEAKAAFLETLSTNVQVQTETSEQLASKLSEQQKISETYEMAKKKFTAQAMEVVSNKAELGAMLNDGDTANYESSAKKGK